MSASLLATDFSIFSEWFINGSLYIYAIILYILFIYYIIHCDDGQNFSELIFITMKKKRLISQFFPLHDHGIGDQLYRVERSSVGRVTIECTHRDTPIAIRD